MTATLEKVKPALDALKQEIGKVIIGQDDAVDKCLIVLLTGAHALIEGAPGVAKTLLARTLAAALWAASSRASSSRPTSCPPTSPAPTSSICNATSSR